MESIAEEPSRSLAEGRSADGIASTQIEESADLRPEVENGPSLENGHAKMGLDGETLPKTQNEGALDRPKGLPRKAAASLEDRQPVRASKRSKPPAPWR